MTTPYAAIPVGAEGLEPERAQVVFGSPLRDTLTRVELARRVAVLTAENADLVEGLLSGQDKALLEQARERLDIECALRVQAQSRLNKVAFCFGAILRRFPETAEIIDAARDEIWDLT